MSTVTTTSLPPAFAAPQTTSLEELRLMYDALLAENSALKATIATTTATLTAALSPVDLAADTPLGSLQTIGRTQLKKQKEANKAWNGALLESIQSLKPDYSGKVGELFIKDIATRGGLTVTYDGDSNINAADGTYDMKITAATEKRDEVKSAYIGSNGGFQHESLRAAGCDQTIFVDMTPDAAYITILKKFALDAPHPVIGRKPHLRKGTTDVYKFDFGLVNIQRAMAAGLAMKVDRTTPLDAVVDFLKRFH